MHDQDLAILRSLVCVAWADGHVADEELEVIEALLQAFHATEAEAAEVRDWAKTPRSLDEIPLTELSAEDRRVLIQHAVLLTHIDGVQDGSERTLLGELCTRLRIPETEREELLAHAEARARKLLDVL